MKLLIVRHGESEDDVIDAYGGWADFPLTQKGREELKQTAEKISKLNYKFEIILSSPLKRTHESAEIISKKLEVPIEILEYVKERNSYGILCGMVKSKAKEKYPWLVEAYEKGEYVDGSERDEDTKTRVRKAYELIVKSGHENVIVATHGVFLKYFFPENFNKKLIKKDDGGMILIDTSTKKVLLSDGIEIA